MHSGLDEVLSQLGNLDIFSLEMIEIEQVPV
jgi:hypothetical protein